ncbi:unnamed protein product [Linum tenue]|uniref:Non-structural maintenance of chromosomes element 1 homolog n=1 Tax=Linum tenue TaxID=586396 RepID=A0AAV0IK54_9ROSI|nr:unnamed protein product [Linum tenue]
MDSFTAEDLSTIGGIATVSLLHSFIPTHWLPFSIVGRAQKWTLSRTLLVTAFGAVLHVISTSLLGITAITMANTIAGEETVHKLASLLLVILGGSYVLLFLSGKGGHSHSHNQPMEKMAVAGLVLVPALSPCATTLPVFLAVGNSSSMMVLAIIVLLISTITVMTSLVALSFYGASQIKFHWVERYDKLLVGSVLCLVKGNKNVKCLLSCSRMLLLAVHRGTGSTLNWHIYEGFKLNRMAVLSWKHHTVIQALMARGPLMEDEFRKIYADVTGKNPRANPKDFNDFTLKINKELSFVQMELRCCRNQNDGRVYYGLVNNIADEQSKLGTKYSIPHIALFKGIVEAIIQDEAAQGCISTITALNIRLENQVQLAGGSQSQNGPPEVPAAIRNFSMSQKDRAIDELIRDNWLSQTTDGDVALGFRSYLDLRSLFHNMGIPPCEVCNESGVKAKVCPTEGCNVRIHEYCLSKKLSRKKDKIVCPSCGINWPFAAPKSEPVEEEEDEQPAQTQTQTQQPSSSGSRRKRYRFSVDVEPDSASAEASQPPPSTRRSTRFSGRSR